MRILHDPDRCASTGMCEAVAPQLFELGPDGALVVLDRHPPAELAAAAADAAAACPTRALRVEE